jgi:general nucleoside transport system ATP-binding protein
MDEPTSVLTPQAVQKLFETLRQLAAEGCSILYISHKLDEIKALCTGATVLRGGKVTGTCDPRNETASSMARMMIGKDLPVCAHAEAAAGGEPRLIIAGLSHKSDDPFGTDIQDVHLTVHSGEIVGIAGVSGNGQQELLFAVSGEEPLAEPFPIRLLGAEVGRMHPGRRRKLGMGFVPEERLGRGAVPTMSLAENALLTAHRAGEMVRGGLVRADRTTAFARNCIEQYTVKCGGPEAEARSLSGGNLQKFIVGREILQAPQVLVVAQPTWGVDVGAAAFIRQALIDLRNRGTAILVISEELDELFEICDRLAVIAKGRLSPAKRTRETNVEEIGVWMSGLWPGAHTDEVQPAPMEAARATQA